MEVVVDSIGAATYASSLQGLSQAGRPVTCGATAGPLAELVLRILWRKQVSLHGSTMATGRESRAVMGLRVTGNAPVVGRPFPLSEVHAAEGHLESAGGFGFAALEA